MDSVKDKQEVYSNGSLMKKTKVQLIEIILRKDELERNLRKEVRELNKSFDISKNKYIKLSDSCKNIYKELSNKDETISVLENDYQEICDKYAELNQINKDNVIRYRKSNIILIFISILASIGFLTMYYLS